MEEITRFNMFQTKKYTKINLKSLKIHIYTPFYPLQRRNFMKTDQNQENQSQNTQESTNSTPSQNKITLSVPNPQIYLSRVKNKLKTTNFFQKTLKFKIFFVFLLILLAVNIKFSVSNVQIRQESKKINEDNLTLYEMLEVYNITRVVYGKQLKYLESILEDERIYVSSFYKSDISDEVYDEYHEQIEAFKQVDYNAVLDQFLNINYNQQLYEKRQQEERYKDKYESRN